VFLDAVLHVASLAIQIVIQRLWIARQIRYHEARIGPLAVVLGLDDDSTFFVPRRGGIFDLGKNPLLLFRQLELLVRLLEIRFSQAFWPIRTWPASFEVKEGFAICKKLYNKCPKELVPRISRQSMGQ